MNKEKGFTLTEILAVIVIISILLLVIAPTILNSAKKFGSPSSDAQKKIVFEATNLYMEQNGDKFPNRSGATYCVKVQTLIDEGQFNSGMKDFKTDEDYVKKEVKIEIANNKNKNFSLVNAGSCKPA